MIYKFLMIAFAALTVILFAGCNNDSTSPTATKAGTFTVETKSLGNGSVSSWYMLDESGKVTSMGLKFTESALMGLPDEESETTLSFGTVADFPFNHIGIDWNPHGHPPEHVYDVPHFDFHFYLISMAERQMITAMGNDTMKCYMQPPQGGLPQDYMIIPGTAVPMMGAHAMDLTSPELNGGAFTKTFIYGYYNGMLIFLEPMVTIDYLKSMPNMDMQMKLPSIYPKSGYYPTHYSISYNASDKTYMVTLSSMMMRNAM
ncbi:MAG: hypothetical protein QG635_908 [Bacteroidota bacterium]|nr:hypothetical protein [Bacteroidota bacterium]